MQRNALTRLCFGVVALVILVSPLFVLVAPTDAQNFGLDQAAKEAGLLKEGTRKGTTQNVQLIIGQLISVLLGFVGIIFLILIIWGGFMWMTAHGEEDKITSAKKLITSAVVGLVIIFAAYVITSFVITQLRGSFNV